MERKTIDKFVEKLRTGLELQESSCEIQNFIGLKNECRKMLDNFNRKQSLPLERLRNLGYFKLEVKHLLDIAFAEKKRQLYLQRS